MTYLRVVLFESPLWLILVALIAELVVMWWYGRLEEPKRAYLFAVPAALVVMLVIQRFVETDQEALRALTRRLAWAIDEPELDAFMACVDADFRLGRTGRDELRDRLYDFLERVAVDNVRLGAFELAVEGDEARVAFRATARVETAEAGIREYVGRWRLTCVRRPDGWRLRGVEHLGSAGLGQTPVEEMTGW